MKKILAVNLVLTGIFIGYVLGCNTGNTGNGDEAEDGGLPSAHADAGGSESATNCIEWEGRIDWSNQTDNEVVSLPAGWEPVGGDIYSVVSRRCVEYEE